MNIVVGYADSPGSDKALDWAVRQAKVFGAKVYVVTSVVGGKSVSQEEIDHAEEVLQKAKDRLEAEHVPCEATLLARGLEPGEDVVEFAKEVGAEQVVIAVRRTSKVGKLLFGSNAQQIILHAPCPVVTVR